MECGDVMRQLVDIKDGINGAVQCGSRLRQVNMHAATYYSYLSAVMFYSNAFQIHINSDHGQMKTYA